MCLFTSSMNIENLLIHRKTWNAYYYFMSSNVEYMIYSKLSNFEIKTNSTHSVRKTAYLTRTSTFSSITYCTNKKLL